MLTREEFAKIINGFLALNIPFPPNLKQDPSVFNVWYAELKHLTRDEFIVIYKIVSRKPWERFPQIAELLECLHGSQSEMVALAWDRVMAVMSNTYNPKPLDEITARALAEILPHRNINSVSEGWDEENIQWRRKEFDEAFRTSYDMHRRGVFEGHELPRLSGAYSEVPIMRVAPEQMRTTEFLLPSFHKSQPPVLPESAQFSPGVKKIMKEALGLPEGPAKSAPPPQSGKSRFGLVDHLRQVTRS